MPTGTNGNTGQAIDKDGWVKAMVLLRADGTIELCYNSTLSGSAAFTPPCGFSAVQQAPGFYDINLGFQVNTRFFSATNAWAPNQSGSPFVNVAARPIDVQTVRVYTSESHSYSSCPSYLVVF